MNEQNDHIWMHKKPETVFDWLVNTRYEVIDKWYKNQVEKIDADILARICFVLRCGVGDLLVYRERQRPAQPRS